MMNDFIFDLPFSETNERKQTNDYFNKIFNPTLILGIVFVVIGAIIFVSTQLLNPAFLIFLYGGYFLYRYFKSKRIVNARLKIVIEYGQKNPNYTQYYTEEGFGMRGSIVDFDCKWNPFSTLELWKDYIQVFHYGKGSNAISINKSEIGEEQFESLKRALLEKIERLKIEVE